MSTIQNQVGSAASTYAVQNNIDKSKSLSDKDKEKLSAVLSEVASNTGNIIDSLGGLSGKSNSLFGSKNSGGNFDFIDFGGLLGGSGDLAYLQAVNKGRITIENKARTLTSEIAMDKIRGNDTSSKADQLNNLAGNLDIMDKTLQKNINTAIGKTSETTTSADGTAPIKYDTAAKAKEPSVISRIREDLAANQKKLDAEFRPEPAATTPATETTTGSSTSTTSTSTAASSATTTPAKPADPKAVVPKAVLYVDDAAEKKAAADRETYAKWEAEQTAGNPTT
ncbi:hypothetical protein FACS189499_02450 [Clostridia bacterium]|nr:hypothetical protein FACS189499_02450 [Clostridia bacterium]